MPDVVLSLPLEAAGRAALSGIEKPFSQSRSYFDLTPSFYIELL
jgi:hypothetical protein